ncbi:hypothetical protein U9K52_01860 [Chryseobacterium sp. MHB01]|uniref:hypothetical protein n=1 Tax=unclassified Chryseobacterium TaxID=2593645 RepID=UPI002AFFC207|nr:hypothetical protein [Chryseobacterium sp. MHB01]MEA1847644.1 hypothetical protein [Chryseobacterium sp. MHB01]
MKKLIPIFSIAIAAMSLQNCSNRDEDLIQDDNSFDEVKMSIMKKDSAKSSEEIIDPDPPVRDGDNWRTEHKD